MNQDLSSVEIYQITEADVDIYVKKIPPIYPEDITVAEYHKAVFSGYRNNLSLLTPREYCVTKVHLSVLREIVKNNKPGLVFESDIEIDLSSVHKFINLKKPTEYFFHLGWMYSTYPLTNFFWKRKFKGNAGDVWYQLTLTDQLWGAYAYAVTPKVAQTMLESQSIVVRKADDWSSIFSIINYGIYYYPLFGHPVERGDLHAERVSSRAPFRKALVGKLTVRLVPRMKRFFSVIMCRRILLKNQSV